MPEPPVIRVLVVDDHPVVRAGLVALLGTIDGLQPIAQAADGMQAVAAATEHRPDVVLMDVRMPGIDGVEATRLIRASLPATKVLVLTMYDDDATVFTAMQAGAHGYLLKNAEQDDIVRAVRAVHGGEVIFGPGVAAQVLRYFAMPVMPEPVREQPFPELTDRERSILDLLAQGRRTSAIAQQLYLSPEDGEQPPHVDLREAPGRQPRRGDRAGPRRWARRTDVRLPLVVGGAAVAISSAASGLVLVRTRARMSGCALLLFALTLVGSALLWHGYPRMGLRLFIGGWAVWFAIALLSYPTASIVSALLAARSDSRRDLAIEVVIWLSVLVGAAVVTVGSGQTAALVAGSLIAGVGFIAHLLWRYEHAGDSDRTTLLWMGVALVVAGMAYGHSAFLVSQLPSRVLGLCLFSFCAARCSFWGSYVHRSLTSEG